LDRAHHRQIFGRIQERGLPHWATWSMAWLPGGRVTSMNEWAIAAVAAALLGGCALAPSPAPLESPSDDVWIRWENRTEDTYVITVLGGGAVAPVWAEAAACMADDMRIDVGEPFSIGIAYWDADLSRPGREVADDRAYREAGGRLLLIIEDGPLLDGPTVTLETWTEQRSRLPGACP
jgi:hypothetical protein